MIKKIEPVVRGENETVIGYMYECPGCKFSHVVYTEERNSLGAKWSFDGNIENPTFSPSIKCTYNYGPKYKEAVCHHFIRNGKIEFLNDCTHELAGKTVDMLPIEN